MAAISGGLLCRIKSRHEHTNTFSGEIHIVLTQRRRRRAIGTGIGYGVAAIGHCVCVVSEIFTMQMASLIGRTGWAILALISAWALCHKRRPPTI